MAITDITTAAGHRVRYQAANSTATSFAALHETIRSTTPSGIRTNGANSILIWPFGTDANDETFNIKVVHWWEGNLSWGYIEGFVGVCTMCTEVGVASGDVIATEFFCDTIAYTSGLAPYSIPSATANFPAFIRIDTLGAKIIQLDFDRVTAASCNAIVARL